MLGNLSSDRLISISRSTDSWGVVFGPGQFRSIQHGKCRSLSALPPTLAGNCDYCYNYNVANFSFYPHAQFS